MLHPFLRPGGMDLTIPCEHVELTTEVEQRFERDTGSTQRQRCARLAIGHPRRDDRAGSVGQRAAEHDLATSCLPVLERESLPEVRVPAVVDFDGLPDAGRMERDL